MFASIYAGYGLYDLFAPPAAFLMLAAVSVCAIGLALFQGPFVAGLGLVGAFVAPLLVATENLSAWTFFTYIAMIVAGCVALLRYVAWWWLGWAALTAAGLWTLIWFVGPWAASDDIALGTFVVTLAGLFLFLRRDVFKASDVVTWRALFGQVHEAERIAWGAAIVAAVLSFILVRMDGYGGASLVTLGALSALFIAIGRREPTFDGLVVAAAAIVVLVIATWHMPEIASQHIARFITETTQGYYPRGPVIPPDLLAFAQTTAAFGTFFGITGFVGL